MSNILEEYLVRIGAQVDTHAFNGAQAAVGRLAGVMGRLTSILKLGPLTVALGALTDSMVNNIKSVARLDMEYAKLANNMWVTKETAKSLKLGMEVMGASEQDIAWIPELREQFFRLRREMNALATPGDADGQLAWIRSIGYDIQSLQLKLKMFKEWLVYYLIKYFQPYIVKLQEFIQTLNDELGSRLPSLANKAAFALYKVFTVLSSAVRAVSYVVGKVYGFLDAMPKKTKALVLAFSAVGALVMTGPFGMMIAALGVALLMLEDFMYFLDGKKSSKRLAPLWEALRKLSEPEGMFGKLGPALQNCFDKFNQVINEIHFGAWTDNSVSAFKELTSAVGGFISKLLELTGIYKLVGDSSDQFYKKLGRLFDVYLNKGNTLMRVIASIINAFTAALDGNYAEASRMGYRAVGLLLADYGAEYLAWKDLLGGGGESSDEKSIYIGLRKRGFTAVAAAGILGNFIQESTLNPKADNGTHRGLGQWDHNDRWAHLVEFSRQRGKDPETVEAQLDFLRYEMEQRGDFEAVNAASTPEEAARIHEARYEISGGDGMENRISNARRVYDLYHDTDITKTETPVNKDSFGGSGGTYASSFMGNGPSHIYPYTGMATTNHNSTINIPGISVQTSSDASPGEIADAVVKKIKEAFSPEGQVSY